METHRTFIISLVASTFIHKILTPGHPIFTPHLFSSEYDGLTVFTVLALVTAALVVALCIGLAIAAWWLRVEPELTNGLSGMPGAPGMSGIPGVPGMPDTKRRKLL